MVSRFQILPGSFGFRQTLLDIEPNFHSAVPNGSGHSERSELMAALNRGFSRLTLYPVRIRVSPKTTVERGRRLTRDLINSGPEYSKRILPTPTAPSRILPKVGERSYKSWTRIFEAITTSRIRKIPRRKLSRFAARCSAALGR